MSLVEQQIGVALPPAGTYSFDQAHTTVDFIGKHIFTKVRGRFTRFDGSITIAEQPEDSRVEAVLEATSLETHTQQRDDHLRSPDFLDVERFPEIRFVSTGLRHTDGTGFELDGELTIKDITNPVTLRGEYLGTGTNPYGKVVASFSASTTLEREDWDMTWNMALEAGGFLVGKSVTIEVEVEALRNED
ncbi:MAG TPA: YceI family protein [Actinomycetota bacterium]|jgi:polyisoprenoid-binding protein YceI